MYGGIAAKDEDKDKESDQDKEEENTNIQEPVKKGYIPGELPLKSDNTSQISGLAVFHGKKMVGVLDSSEAQTYAMMTKSKTRIILTLPDPLDPDSNVVVAVLSNGNSRISSHFENGKPVFEINVDLHCTIECIQSDTDYTTDQNYNLLTEYVKQSCTENMQNLVTKIQKKYNADILKLGNKLAHNFLTDREFENYKWPDKYQNADIRITVHLDIDRTGILKA